MGMVADCQSRFIGPQALPALAADLLSAAQPLPTPKTRVRGSRRRPSGRLLQPGRFRSINTPGLRACAYKTASGRRKWPNRDPWGEFGFQILQNVGIHVKEASDGNPNAYSFVAGDPEDFADTDGRAWWPPSKWPIWPKPKPKPPTPTPGLPGILNGPDCQSWLADPTVENCMACCLEQYMKQINLWPPSRCTFNIQNCQRGCGNSGGKSGPLK